MSPSLPASPSLEQLRRRAKDLLRALRAGDAAAVARVAAAHPHPPGEARLADAQLVIAREHGFASWPRLRAYVERIAAHGPDLQHAYRADFGYYRDRAEGLLASALDGTPAAVGAFSRWSLPFDGAGARSVVAREHGFRSWPAMARHVRGLRTSGDPFAQAYDAVEARDEVGLAVLLDRSPELVGLSGTNGNDLLGMATATGSSGLVSLLLARGANPAHANVHGATALHQAAYAGRLDIAQLLLAAGAPVDVSARGDGGTPLVTALFWGHEVPLEVVESIGLHPRNLRVAAGLGLLDLIDELVPENGPLDPDAGAHRAFYRPHSGFPYWNPSDDPREVLDEATSWAARCNHAEAITLLVARGADPDADVYRGTPLAWAASCNRAAAIRMLLAVGADPNGRTTFGGPDHGENATPLHLAAGDGHLDAITLLLEAGADPMARDGRFDATPEGWAEHGGHRAAIRLLRPSTA